MEEAFGNGDGFSVETGDGVVIGMLEGSIDDCGFGTSIVYMAVDMTFKQNKEI